MGKISNFNDYINEGEELSTDGKILIIMGPPGSGKGTVSKKLSDKKGILHISTGDLIRNSEDEDLKRSIARGNYAPDSVMIKMLRKKIKESDISKGLIFDGFPRTIKQAKMLDSMLGKIGLGLSHALYLDVDEDIAKDRIRERSRKENREDDKSEDTINKRFSEYQEKTLPILDFYKRSRKSVKIDASKSPENVYKQIIKKISF